MLYPFLVSVSLVIPTVFGQPSSSPTSPTLPPGDFSVADLPDQDPTCKFYFQTYAYPIDVCYRSVVYPNGTYSSSKMTCTTETEVTEEYYTTADCKGPATYTSTYECENDAYCQCGADLPTCTTFTIRTFDQKGFDCDTTGYFDVQYVSGLCQELGLPGSKYYSCHERNGTDDLGFYDALVTKTYSAPRCQGEPTNVLGPDASYRCVQSSCTNTDLGGGTTSDQPGPKGSTEVAKSSPTAIIVVFIVLLLIGLLGGGACWFYRRDKAKRVQVGFEDEDTGNLKSSEAYENDNNM